MRDTWIVPVKRTVAGHVPPYEGGSAVTDAAATSGLPGLAGRWCRSSQTVTGPRQVTLNLALADRPFLPRTSTACQPEVVRSKVWRSRTTTARVRLTRALLTALRLPSPRTQR